MLPVLFRIVIPAGLGKPAFALLAVAVVLARVIGAVRAARRDGGSLSFLAALRSDLPMIGVLALGCVVLARVGLLDGRIELPVHAYGLLIAAGFLSGIWAAQREARRRGQDPERIADLAFWVLVAAVVGSRVYFIGVNWREYLTPATFLADTPLGRIPRVLAVWEGGLVFYGGFIGAALTAFLYLRRHRMPFLAYADTIIPSVALGHVFGRLGCFCAGCCWGAVAPGGLPWGARFPPGSLAYQSFAARADPAAFLAPGGATTLPLHPTQLYEALGELALFLLLVVVVRPRKRFHGQVLATWLLLYAGLRFTVELFRGDVERGVWLGLGAGQWTSLVILGAGALLWARARREPAPAAPTAAAV